MAPMINPNTIQPRMLNIPASPLYKRYASNAIGLGNLSTGVKERDRLADACDPVQCEGGQCLPDEGFGERYLVGIMLEWLRIN